MSGTNQNWMNMSMAGPIFLTLLVFMVPGVYAADDLFGMGGTSGVGYYKGDYVSTPYHPHLRPVHHIRW